MQRSIRLSQVLTEHDSIPDRKGMPLIYAPESGARRVPGPAGGSPQCQHHLETGHSACMASLSACPPENWSKVNAG